MTAREATEGLVRQGVKAVRKQRADADTIAVRAEPRWDNGLIDVDGARVAVQPCTSVLAVRSSLAEWASTADSDPRPHDVLVVVCDLADAELGQDVLARFTPPRVLGLDPWGAVEELFGVRHLDAAFGDDDGWIAAALLDHVPTRSAQSMTAGGVLTIEVAYDALSQALLGADHLDVDSVLQAAADARPFAGVAGPAGEHQRRLLDALGRRQGPLGRLVAAIIGAGHGDQLLALGLAARAVYGAGDLDGGTAAGRFESRCGAEVVEPSVGAALAERCEEVVRRQIDHDLDRERATSLIAAAAEICQQIVAPFAEASDLLPQGYEQRIAIVGALIATILDELEAGSIDRNTPVFDDLLQAVHQVANHNQRRSPAGRLRFEHAEMAARLVTWLATPELEPSHKNDASFEDMADRYSMEEAWVDRARRRLWRGDSATDVREVYRRLIDRVVERRSGQNQRFADRLAGWTATPTDDASLKGHDLLKVEDVARRLLAPLARTMPVLLVILDGCGLPSFSELAPQFNDAGFREVVPDRGGVAGPSRRMTAIAALPTVTEVSRASLIAGRLDRGNAEHERRQFEANSDLTIGGRAPAFFHQNRLTGPAGSSLSAELERAISADGPQVVGVVINTIDDQLRKGDFTAQHDLWDLHALVWLLEAARTHGRAVVVTADHGHVLAQPADGGTGAHHGGGGAGGERWRQADRPPAGTEVRLHGTRVLLGNDEGILAPWDDDFRYGAKAGGYHGGATPEEVLVPAAVFVPAGEPSPAGWELGGNVAPVWWGLHPVEPPRALTGSVSPSTRPRKGATKAADKAQGSMFELPEPTPGGGSTARPAASVRTELWIEALLVSDVWKLQRGAAGRANLPEERLRRVLSAISQRGGVTSFAALASDADVPRPRLSGFLTLLARVLNVDGYAVLEVDTSAQEVRLSTGLLAQQFEIVVS